MDNNNNNNNTTPSREPKGKNAKDVTETDAPPPSTQPGPSLLSRISQSAASLSQDAIGSRPLSRDLAALSSADKAGPSRASSGPLGSAVDEGSSSFETSRRGSSHTANMANMANTTQVDTFSSSHSQQHIAAQEDAFSSFLEGADVDTSIPETLPGTDSRLPLSPFSAENSAQASTGSAARTAAPRTEAFVHSILSDVAKQQSQDGLAVFQLLASDHEEEPGDLHDVELAEDELAGLQRALFGTQPQAASGTAPHTAPATWDHVLNFIPPFLRQHLPTDGGPSDLLFGSGLAEAPVGTASGMNAQDARLWLDQWRGVLTRYDEEVWAGLAPLVAEARDEVEKLEGEMAAGSTKALGRLQQILGHLRGDMK